MEAFDNMEEEIEELKDFFFLFGPLAISLLFTSFLCCLECLCYHKTQFPAISKLSQSKTVIKQRPKRAGKAAVSHGDTLLVSKASMNALNQQPALNMEEKVAPPPLFPLATAWPVFHCLFYIIAPLALLAPIAEYVASQDESYVFFNASVSEELSVEALFGFDLTNILVFTGNACLWLGCLFFGFSLLADFFLLFSANLGTQWYELFPLSYGKRLNKHFLMTSLFFFTVSVGALTALVIFSVDENKKLAFSLLREHALSADISRISVICCLVLVLLIGTLTYKGVYVLLSFFYLDFVTRWRNVVHISEGVIIVLTILAIGQLNEYAGLILMGQFLLFVVIPYVMNGFIACMEVHTAEVVSEVEEAAEVQDKKLGYMIQYLQFTIQVKGRQQFGQVGQKLPISLIRQPFSTGEVVISDVVLVEHEEVEGRYSTKLTCTYVEVYHERGQYLKTGCASCIRFLHKTLWVCVLVPIYTCFYSSFWILSSTVPEIGDLPRYETFNVKFSQPVGRPLKHFYQFAQDTHDKRSRMYCFYADDFGYQQALAHYKRCRKDRLRAQFTFYCSDFRTLFAIVFFLYDQDTEFYEKILHQERRRETSDFMLSFILQDRGCKPDKHYIRRLCLTLVEKLGELYEEDDKDAFSNLTTFLCERTHMVGLKYAYLPEIEEDKQGSGSSHYFCFLGASDLVFNLKPRIKSKKPKNAQYFESITEPCLTNLPYARYASNYYGSETEVGTVRPQNSSEHSI